MVPGGAPQGGLSCPFGAIHLLYGGKHSSHGATCERGPAPRGRTSFAPKRSADPRRSRGLPSCRRWRHGAFRRKAERIKIMVPGGVYGGNHPSQAASVESGRPIGRPLYARSRPATPSGPPSKGWRPRGLFSLKCSSVHFSETQFRIYTLQSLRPKLMHSA